MSIQLSDHEIMEAYKAAEELRRPVDFARALGVSRQRMSAWLSGKNRPQTEWLVVQAMQYDDGWIGEMAQAMLAMRGIVIWSQPKSNGKRKAAK